MHFHCSRIFIKEIRSIHNDSVAALATLDVELSNSVRHVKEMVQECTGISAERLRLLFLALHQPQLEDDRTLADYNIQLESTLLLLHRPGYG